MSAGQGSPDIGVVYGDAGSQYQTWFDPERATIWGYFNPRGIPCFSLDLLRDIGAHDGPLVANGGRIEIEGQLRDVRYYVCGSRIPRVFNLGGDLSLFLNLIRARDRQALADYARICIDTIFARIHNYSSPLITLSLVQGHALGGGMECALSSDIVVAEESARMGLPEILFNLFPGMGAYSLIERRIGRRGARR